MLRAGTPQGREPAPDRNGNGKQQKEMIGGRTDAVYDRDHAKRFWSGMKNIPAAPMGRLAILPAGAPHE